MATRARHWHCRCLAVADAVVVAVVDVAVVVVVANVVAVVVSEASFVFHGFLSLTSRPYSSLSQRISKHSFVHLAVSPFRAAPAASRTPFLSRERGLREEKGERVTKSRVALCAKETMATTWCRWYTGNLGSLASAKQLIDMTTFSLERSEEKGLRERKNQKSAPKRQRQHPLVDASALQVVDDVFHASKGEGDIFFRRNGTLTRVRLKKGTKKRFKSFIREREREIEREEKERHGFGSTASLLCFLIAGCGGGVCVRGGERGGGFVGVWTVGGGGGEIKYPSPSRDLSHSLALSCWYDCDRQSAFWQKIFSDICYYVVHVYTQKVPSTDSGGDVVKFEQVKSKARARTRESENEREREREREGRIIIVPARWLQRENKGVTFHLFSLQWRTQLKPICDGKRLDLVINQGSQKQPSMCGNSLVFFFLTGRRTHDFILKAAGGQSFWIFATTLMDLFL